MLSLYSAFQNLKQQLQSLYSSGEATAIAHELLAHITGLNKLQRLTEKEKLFTSDQFEQFENATSRLLNGEPLQYITAVQWFLGKPFYVNKHVLIPRPETEELVQWIIAEWKEKQTISILDIGTGSGCIPISLKLQLQHANISSCDISKDALDVAQKNASNFAVEVNFIQLDFLEANSWQQIDRYDVIVSNPPYIPLSEKESLDKNVRDYEPDAALFVPEDDALLFYRKIALFGKKHLQPNGAIYCELHRDYAVATKELFEAMNYKDVSLRKDIHGNDRMLKAQ